MRDLHRILAAAVCAVAGHAAAAQDWSVVDLGTLGGPGSYGAAIANDGTVVGCADVSPIAAHAFAWKDGAMRDLGTGGPSDGSSCALAVNSRGEIAGRSSTREVVLWKDGGVTRLGIQGDVGAINESGVVVGAAAAANGTTRAFVYANGTVIPLGDASAPSAALSINDRGDIVGRSNGTAFLYANGAMRDLGTLGGNNGGARDINDHGVIVGMASNATGQPASFIYRDAMTTLPGPGTGSSAIAINDRGQVVGSSEGVHGWLVDNGTYTELSRLAPVVAKGWRNLEPTGINDHGWIVGTAVDREGNLRAFVLVPGKGPAPKPLRLVGR